MSLINAKKPRHNLVSFSEKLHSSVPTEQRSTYNDGPLVSSQGRRISQTYSIGMLTCASTILESCVDEKPVNNIQIRAESAGDISGKVNCESPPHLSIADNKPQMSRKPSDSNNEAQSISSESSSVEELIDSKWPNPREYIREQMSRQKANIISSQALPSRNYERVSNPQALGFHSPVLLNRTRHYILNRGMVRGSRGRFRFSISRERENIEDPRNRTSFSAYNDNHREERMTDKATIYRDPFKKIGQLRMQKILPTIKFQLDFGGRKRRVITPNQPKCEPNSIRMLQNSTKGVDQESSGRSEESTPKDYIPKPTIARPRSESAPDIWKTAKPFSLSQLTDLINKTQILEEGDICDEDTDTRSEGEIGKKEKILSNVSSVSFQDAIEEDGMTIQNNGNTNCFMPYSDKCLLEDNGGSDDITTQLVTPVVQQSGSQYSNIGESIESSDNTEHVNTHSFSYAVKSVDIAVKHSNVKKHFQKMQNAFQKIQTKAIKTKPSASNKRVSLETILQNFLKMKEELSSVVLTKLQSRDDKIDNNKDCTTSLENDTKDEHDASSDAMELSDLNDVEREKQDAGRRAWNLFVDGIDTSKQLLAKLIRKFNRPLSSLGNNQEGLGIGRKRSNSLPACHIRPFRTITPPPEITPEPKTVKPKKTRVASKILP